MNRKPTKFVPGKPLSGRDTTGRRVSRRAGARAAVSLCRTLGAMVSPLSYRQPERAQTYLEMR